MKVSSSSDIKAKTGRLSDREVAAANNRKTQFLVTVVGVSIIISCGLYVIYTRYAAASRQPAGKIISLKNEENAFCEQILVTRKQADEAYHSKDPVKIRAALGTIDNLKTQLMEFNNLALKAGWSDHDVEVWTSQLHLEETWNKRRLLKDALIVRQ